MSLYDCKMCNYRNSALLCLNNALLLDIFFYFQEHSAEYLHSQIFTSITVWLDIQSEIIVLSMWTIRNEVLPSLKRITASQCQLMFMFLSFVMQSTPSGIILNLWFPRSYCIFKKALWADPPRFCTHRYNTPLAGKIILHPNMSMS